MSFVQSLTILGRLFILDTLVSVVYYGIYALLYVVYGSIVFQHDHTSLKVFEAVVMLIISKRLFDHCLNHTYQWPAKFSVQCENATMLRFLGFQLISMLGMFVILAVLWLMGVLPTIVQWFSQHGSLAFNFAIAGFLYLLMSFIVSIPMLMLLNRVNFYILEFYSKS